MKTRHSVALAFVGALLLAACAGPAAEQRASTVSDEMLIAELWSSIRTDLMHGRTEIVETRARRLASLQAERCRQLRSALLDDPERGIDASQTTNLARCEKDLRQYSQLANLSDYGSRAFLIAR